MELGVIFDPGKLQPARARIHGEDPGAAALVPAVQLESFAVAVQYVAAVGDACPHGQHVDENAASDGVDGDGFHCGVPLSFFDGYIIT